MPNSVRMSAPVGQTSRQPALVQCLQTSLDMSQRMASTWPGSPAAWPRTSAAGPSAAGPTAAAGTCCSMKATCRQVEAPRPTVLSNDMPVSFSPSSGTAFHSLQATSQALQPMQTDVSVKKPIRGGCSPYPARAAGSGPPVRPGSSSATLTSHLRARLFGDAGPLQVRAHQVPQRRPAGRRPGWMSTASALTSWMCTFGSSEKCASSLAASPVEIPLGPQW